MVRAARAEAGAALTVPALEEALQANREAVAAFHAAAAKNAATWTTPRAPAKWSPAEIAEHLAVAYDLSAGVFEGKPMPGASLPRLLRPILRAIVFTPVIRKRGYGRPVRTLAAMTPESPAASPAEAQRRLEAAVAGFEAAARGVGRNLVEHSSFGRVAVADYVRFSEIHTRHHLHQLPVH